MLLTQLLCRPACSQRPVQVYATACRRLCCALKAMPVPPAPLSCVPPRFADPLAEAHAPERLGKFEELLEAAVDMARVPDEYVISPTYDSVRLAG